MNPPPPLDNLEAVTAYVGRSRDPKLRALLRFAERNALERPPVLTALTRGVPVPRYTNRARLVRRGDEPPDTVSLPGGVRAELVQAAFEAPRTYEQALALVVERGRRFAKDADAPGGTPGPASPSRRVVRMLELRGEVSELLAAGLRSYLNTRNRESLAFLRRSLLLLLLYERASAGREPKALDRELVAAARDLEIGGAGLPLAVHGPLRGRLEELRWGVFRAYALRFLGRFREDVHRISGVPANLKTNVFGVLRRVVDGEQGIEGAQAFVQRVTEAFEEGPFEAYRPRLKSVTDNFFDKVRAADRVFEGLLDGGGHSLKPRRNLTSGAVGLIVERALMDPEFLLLQPSKDYGDLLKGHASGDCTAGEELAAAHLGNRRFFNIRILGRHAWVGNVYALDFTDRGAVVLDKIQLRSAPWFPDGLLPEFLRALVDGVLGKTNAAILAPPAVSNTAWVQDPFSACARGKPKAPFRMGPAEGAFESSKALQMVVLRAAPGRFP